LAISQKFVQLLGGTISVNSEIGKGSVFTVDVPVHAVDIADIEIKPVVRHVIGLAPDQPRYRILIVDDNRDSRQFLVNLLSPLGFELRQAENGQEALKVWKGWEPHLIWMDLRMPVMDGYEATRRIRKAELLNNRQSTIANQQSKQSTINNQQSTIIIALTASPFDEVRTAAFAAGCEDLLGKPFHEANIFDLMHKHLGVRYVYAEEKNPKSEIRNPKSEEVLTPVALAALPSDLVANLEHATLRSDAELIDQVIYEIRTHDTGLADALARLANTFAYDTILKLVQEAE
jgi:CheY-like chemotaxis protein